MARNFSKEFILSSLPSSERVVYFQDFLTRGATPGNVGNSEFLGVSTGTYTMSDDGVVKVYIASTTTGAAQYAAIVGAVRAFKPADMEASFRVRHFCDTAGTAYSGFAEFGMVATTANAKQYGTSDHQHLSFALKTTDSNVRIETVKSGASSQSVNLTTVSHNSSSYSTYTVKTELQNDGTIDATFFKDGEFISKLADVVDSTSRFAPYVVAYNVSETSGYSAANIDYIKIDAAR